MGAVMVTDGGTDRLRDVSAGPTGQQAILRPVAMASGVLSTGQLHPTGFRQPLLGCPRRQRTDKCGYYLEMAVEK